VRNQWQRLYADPQSISGLAALFQQSEIITNFRNLDPLALTKQIAKALASRRYSLQQYRNKDGAETFGLLRLWNFWLFYKIDFFYNEFDSVFINILY
jgi:hypothetical protein